MEFSPRFRQFMSAIFSSSEGSDYDRLDSTIVSLDDNNVYTKGIIIDISEDIVEIPVMARVHYEAEIRSKLDLPDRVLTKKIILPLYTNTRPQNRRTFDSILSQMSTLPYGSRLAKFITNKGDVYYGGRGILFDENMNPLMLCTVAARHSKVTVGDAEKGTLEYFRPVVHISPEVFGERSTKLMEKGIIKKLIPFYSSNSIYFPMSNDLLISSNADSRVCKVVIDKLDKFFITPIKPTPSTCSDEILNQCLVDNIEDVMQQLEL